ncbi:MAG: ABC transporter ATP-binding protein [Flavobacteriaceae bacterium]|nr:ABC transporter ATP-binding protein [Flavobacteriaceae bacterium]
MGNTKNNISLFGFFSYCKKIVGWHIYGYILLNLFVGLLDGLGLTLFIPLLSVVSGSGSKTDEEALGKLQHFLDFIEYIGIELNLLNALALMVFIFCIKAFFDYVKNVYFAKIRLRTTRKLRLQLISLIDKLSYSGYTKMEVGRIQNTMIGELGKLLAAIGAYLGTVQNLVMLLTYIVLAFLSNWQFAFLVVLGGSLSNFLYKFLNNYTKEKSRILSSKGHDFNGLLVQVLNNFKYLKATNYFAKYSKKLTDNIEEQEDIQFKMSKIGSIAGSLREPIIISIIAGVIMIQTIYFNTAFSSIVVSLLLFYRGLSHTVSVQNTWNGFLGSSAGVESFDNLLKELKDYQEPQYYTDKINCLDDITLENIRLSFGELVAIDGISLNIKKNSSVAFVGESGAGKTTLANIICGLQIPDSGDVIINGKSLYKTELNAFRKHIGYITQEAVIFNDSVFNNVTFWEQKNAENLEKFHKVMEKVALKDFLERLPNKENSQLGNNGILISGGQKQRISIARELYKDISLLVMDEATSALDSETERHIKNSIDLLQGQTTLIIIAHRLSTIKDVDMIHLLDKGKIIASGNFNDLYNTSERFRKMVELQAMQ